LKYRHPRGSRQVFGNTPYRRTSENASENASSEHSMNKGQKKGREHNPDPSSLPASVGFLISGVSQTGVRPFYPKPPLRTRVVARHGDPQGRSPPGIEFNFAD
jgi:hypothetical protein